MTFFFIIFIFSSFFLRILSYKRLNFLSLDQVKNDCSHLNYCSNHGKCIENKCKCEQNYTNDDCSSLKKQNICLENCSPNGICDQGKCRCFIGYYGSDCSKYEDKIDIFSENAQNNSKSINKYCKNNCSFNGICFDSKCNCNKGYSGEDCSNFIIPEKNCETNCKNGICMNQTCICQEGYYSYDCSLKKCPPCLNNGLCNPETGKCFCLDDWKGDDCGMQLCQNNCSNNGVCNTLIGKCICNQYYTSIDCSESIAPSQKECNDSECFNNCSNNGICDKGKCYCSEGWAGFYCDQQECPNSCSTHGVCNSNFTCSCDFGYKGKDCSEIIPSCEMSCSNHGQYINKTCVCEESWSGLNCSIQLCEQNCSNNGICENGICYCNTNYSGAYCQTPLCPQNCNFHGNCLQNFTCDCYDPYKGEYCELYQTVNLIENKKEVICLNGIVKNSLCLCKNGYTGDHCEIKTCPNECSFNGVCLKNGTCSCYEGYKEVDCSLKEIKNGYFSIEGVPICNKGWTGRLCNTLLCKNDCSLHGYCKNGTCVCDNNYVGLECEHKKTDCDLKCFHGDCDSKGDCNCNEGWTGMLCNNKVCMENCSNHGKCNNGSCECDLGYIGLVCEVSEFNETCGHHGIFKDGFCTCEQGWTGKFCNEISDYNCTEHQCPNNCSGNGNCSGPPLYQCQCNENFMGISCNETLPRKKIGCEVECYGHGMCIMELCLCQANFEGFSCEIEITQQEKIDCHNNCIKKCINEDLNIFTCLDACFKQYKNLFDK